MTDAHERGSLLPSERAKQAFADAMTDAARVLDALRREGREDRAAGLAVSVDLGTSAAFLFSLSDRAYADATNVVRQAIAQATRTEES